jgi:hypothetical protein
MSGSRSIYNGSNPKAEELKQNHLSNVRARRSQCIPQPISPAASEAPEDDSSQARQRLEQKRATDRAAQREHRKRQKQYVHELEAQLELVKSRHGSESLALLMKENERLQAEVILAIYITNLKLT